MTTLVLLWLAGTLAILVALDAWLGAAAPLLILPAWIVGTLALAAVCGGFAVIRAKRGPLLLIPAMALAVAAMLPLTDALAGAGVQLRFWLERPGYDRVVETILAGKMPPARVAGTRTPILRDPVDRRRVGFYWQGGVPDGWSGVIYDPADAVLAAPREGQLQRQEPPPFAAGHAACRRVAGHYAYCSLD